MSSPKEKKQKKSPEEKEIPNIAIDALIARIIASPNLSLMERLELRKVNRQFKTLIDEYYSKPEVLHAMSYNDLMTLQRVYRNRRDLYLHTLVNDINRITTEFIGEGTGRVSVLTRKLRSGKFTLAIAQRLRDLIQGYLDENWDRLMPENQQGITAHTQHEYADIQKKLTMLDKYINRQNYSSKKTSSLGKYYQDEFAF